MREIKFRFYDKETNKLYQNDDIDTITIINNCISGLIDTGTTYEELEDNVIAMQYTDKKDRNEVDIYEGDILLIGFDINGNVILGEVKYDNAHFYIDRLGKHKGTHALSDVMPESIEVIGNVYINTELLESEMN
jgi:uncharacterized phage protein (TIGR01671 family)